jgi:hypothetical protein
MRKPIMRPYLILFDLNCIPRNRPVAFQPIDRRLIRFSQIRKKPLRFISGDNRPLNL